MRILIGRLPKETQCNLRAAIDPAWTHTVHAQGRQTEKLVTDDMLRDCLTNGRLIEVHNEANSLRVLLRNIDGTCAVVDLDTKVVVTCYWNHPDDRHTTIRRSEYYWGPIGRKVLKRLGVGV